MTGLIPNLAATVLLAGCQVDTVKVGGITFTSSQIKVEGADVAAADLNGDGHFDLVGAGEPLTIFLGDGTGGLTPSARVPGGENPTDIALADIDRDGVTDIIVANHDTDYVTILLGDGHGSFEAAPQSPFRINVSPHPHAVEAVDLDGDDILDLIVDDRNGNGLRVFRGLGEGRLDGSGMLVNVGGDPYIGMAVGDLNGDGRLDLVTPNPRNVAVVFGEDREELRFGPPAALEAENPFGVQLADFNGDGLLDLISVSGENSSTTDIFFGDGQGGFSRAGGWEPVPLRGPKMTAIGDFNGDGLDDAAVTCYQSSNAMIVLGGRDSLQTVQLPAGEHPWGLAPADFNGDGVDDLVIADDARPEAIVYLSTAPLSATEK